MHSPDKQVHQWEHRADAGRQIQLEHSIIEVFRSYTGQPMDKVSRLEHVSQICHPDGPRPALLFCKCLQRNGGSAVASTSIEVNQVDQWAGRRNATYRAHACSWFVREAISAELAKL